jgi:hypothetical protein
MGPERWLLVTPEGTRIIHFAVPEGGLHAYLEFQKGDETRVIQWFREMAASHEEIAKQRKEEETKKNEALNPLGAEALNAIQGLLRGEPEAAMVLDRLLAAHKIPEHLQAFLRTAAAGVKARAAASAAAPASMPLFPKLAAVAASATPAAAPAPTPEPPKSPEVSVPEDPFAKEMARFVEQAMHAAKDEARPNGTDSQPTLETP